MLDRGRAGILVDDLSVDGWRAALGTALRHTETWNDLGQRGFGRMQKLYTVEAMADAYESAIAAVL
jgi:glycosyltransferase involved in cell wall biosynthesis